MKIKVLPQDFIVQEICEFKLKDRGDFSIYKLEKESWDTFDLLDYLSRKYKLKNIGRAGIKDRYSHSIQYISIRNGKASDIVEKNFKLSFIGKANEPITLNSQQGNFFQIVIRDLNQKETEYIKENLESIKQFGLANYYDEQRMGSARAGQGFIGQKLVMKHFNGALKLYLASPSKFDDSRMRKLKKHVLTNWGNWQKCLDVPYEFGQFQYPLLYLVKHPNDFKGAIKTIRRDLLEMFINAYQSYIWNETIKGLIHTSKIDYFKSRYGFGDLYFYNQLEKTDFEYLSDLSISAPSYKASFTDNRIKEIMEQVLSKDNLKLKDLKINLNIKGLFFKPYERKVLIIPEDLKLIEIVKDELYLYPDKYKIVLSFNLPKGSYATILIKRISSFQK